jgi:hypothetical protein
VAQRTQILYVDDIDGSEAEGTVRFGLDGTEYEIDLNKNHSAQFTKAIRPYIDAARKVSSSRRPARGSRPARHNQSDVRAWARSQDLKISDRGRIPADVLARYESAH